MKSQRPPLKIYENRDNLMCVHDIELPALQRIMLEVVYGAFCQACWTPRSARSDDCEDHLDRSVMADRQTVGWWRRA
jgi:hypothetical protein